MNPPLAPARFGKYPVLGLLGRGAMGAVYRAFDPDIGRSVAIKTTRWDPIHDGTPAGSLAERFRNEARAAGRLSHPGIVAVYEYGQSDDCAYIAMEHVEGANLRECLARGVAFAEADVVSIMTQLLDALGHAHERKVWHRDIKPANLILMNDGRLKIADFGIARIEATDIAQSFPTMGTPGYMPPEMYRGEAGDQRADIFAAGAVMYQLLAGRAPFEGAAGSAMLKVCHQDPPPMRGREQTRRWAHYDPVLAMALAKTPERRFAGTASFRDALRAAYGRPASATVSRDAVTAAVAAEPARDPGHAAVSTSAPTRRLTGSDLPRTPSLRGWNPGTPGSIPAPYGAIAARAPLAADEIERTTRALARHLGPLARVIVKRASARGTEPEQFYLRVIEAIGSEAEREEFLREVLGASR